METTEARKLNDQHPLIQSPRNKSLTPRFKVLRLHKLFLIFRFQAMPFSEKFILAGCFSRFAHLTILKMPNICDDDLLAKIGESCRNLEEMDLAGSFGVTNQGKCDQKTFESGHI